MLYLIRHGQTDWNLENKIQGQYDIALNGIGRAQANDLAEKIKPFNLTRIISSDLSRAAETAQIIGNKLNITVNYDARLREYDFGKFTGLNRAMIEPALVQAFFLAPTEFDAESYEAAFVRVGNFLSENDYGTDTLVVTHGGVINFALCYMEDKNNFNPHSYLDKCLHLKFDNGAILRLRDLHDDMTVLRGMRFQRLEKSK